ncbi:MAG: DUF3592 domain-containing protein [Parvularculaceae bacterium]|nr:DUF3592 domain-containing protein [Parvularculaceae bacterium]
MDTAVLIKTMQQAFAGPRLIFSVIGWSLLAGAFFLAVQADEARREWIRVDGEIVDFTDGETDAPIVEYVAPNGSRSRITGKISSSPRAGQVGDRVPVLINPDDPEITRLGTPLELWFAPGLLGAIGGVFVIIGALSGGAIGAGRLPGQLSERRLQALRETGERVMARVTGVMAVGAGAASRTPAHWRLEAQALNPEAGAPAVYISQPIKIDPAPYVKVGDEVGVYVDRDNPKIYAFDFSMLPFGS